MGGGVSYALVLILASVAADAESAYAWPLDLPRVLTSSFAEYRPGRFHMGIDLRTGPIGKDVFAAADGYVSRVRCSPYGYGKAVYVQLDDGNTAIYAHLDDFVPELREYVRRAQHDRKRYTVDLYPDPGTFPIERGQRIAKSGQTGIGVPHLHYELRDRSGAPVNPRLLGVSWPDTGRPRFRGAVVIPAAPETLINGDMLPVVLPARTTSTGQYRADSVRVTGAVAFGVDVIDPANGGGTRLGVRTLRTRVGAQEIFVLQHDRVAYGDGQDGAVAYHPYLMDEGRFLMQWRWPGNGTDIYAQTAADGRYQPGAESGDVVVVAEDFHGNEATLTIPIASAAERVVGEPAQENDAFGSVSYDYFPEWLLVTVEFPKAEATFPTLRGLEGVREAAFRRVGKRTFRAAVVPDDDVTAVRLSVEHPRVDPVEELFVVAPRGSKREVMIGDQVHLDVPSESAYGTLFIRVAEVVPKVDEILKAYGSAYRVGDSRSPIDESVHLSLALPADALNAERVHLYRQGRRGWEFQNSERRGGRLWTSASQLGVFATLEDVTSPTIKNVRPRAGQRFNTRRPTVRASIADRGSMIDSFSAKFNGRWLLMAYDPEQQMLEWEADEDLSEGTGEIEFRVSDMAGNVAVARVPIEILPANP